MVDRFLKLGFLILGVLFLGVYFKNAENGRYQFQAFGTQETDIVILDTREGIIFRVNQDMRWISSYVVDDSARSWAKYMSEIDRDMEAIQEKREA